jgi:hypothetical protein
MERARVSTEGAPQLSSIEDEEKTGHVVMPEIAARPAGGASERGSDTGRRPARWQSTGEKAVERGPSRLTGGRDVRDLLCRLAVRSDG